MDRSGPIYITKPSLGSLEQYHQLLEQVWNSRQLTNSGPLAMQLERELASTLQVQFPLLVSNGTIALHVAIRALELQNCEIITTPFTWVSSASSIVWEQCTPVFVDVDKATFNIDPQKIEAAITDRTKAILAVHVFSNPCDVVAIESIAAKYNLKVIYDAAHAFAVRVGDKSIFEYGDISTASFHATKVFNTAEGGAVFSSTKELYEMVHSVRDFGFDRARDIVRLGTNGKMSELSAALGLVNLPIVADCIAKRKERYGRYKNILGNRVQYQQYDEQAYNYAYMPVVFEDEDSLLQVMEGLNAIDVYPRRYFHPSLSEMNKVFDKPNTPMADAISKRILCLPLYPDLAMEHVEAIANEIVSILA